MGRYLNRDEGSDRGGDVGVAGGSSEWG